MTPRRALIVFAKLPRIGEVKTRLGAVLGPERAVEIYKQMAERAFSLAAEMSLRGIDVHIFYGTGSPLDEVRSWVGFPFSYHEQSGETLGAKMESAFTAVFARGSTAAVVVGTDVPHLSVDILASAFDLLTNTDIVIGPCVDGGYYLLGMNFPTKPLFTGIPWSTSGVLAATVKNVHGLHLSLSLLPELSDIDTVDDYVSYRKSQRT